MSVMNYMCRKLLGDDYRKENCDFSNTVWRISVKRTYLYASLSREYLDCKFS